MSSMYIHCYDMRWSGRNDIEGQWIEYDGHRKPNNDKRVMFRCGLMYMSPGYVYPSTIDWYDVTHYKVEEGRPAFLPTYVPEPPKPPKAEYWSMVVRYHYDGGEHAKGSMEVVTLPYGERLTPMEDRVGRFARSAKHINERVDRSCVHIVKSVSDVGQVVTTPFLKKIEQTHGLDPIDEEFLQSADLL